MVAYARLLEPLAQVFGEGLPVMVDLLPASQQELQLNAELERVVALHYAEGTRDR